MSAFFKHLKTIINHKRYVGKYCFMCGLYHQGIVHDMSKFSPTEFLESVKYYVGTGSPIDECKKINGYSMAWLHHRGRNPHHWEYWTDNYAKGTTAIKIPWKYMLEMFCDFLGAGRAYGANSNKKFIEKEFIESEYNWWLNRKKEVLMDPVSMMLMDYFFIAIRIDGIESLLKNPGRLESIKRDYESNHPTAIASMIVLSKDIGN